MLLFDDVTLRWHIDQELEEATEALRDPQAIQLSSLDITSYNEILQQALPGEIQYIWQMAKNKNGPDDVDFLVLPTCISKVLDREYARWVCANPDLHLREIVGFGIHVGFGTEARVGWFNERTYTDREGCKQFRKHSSKVMAINFDRANLNIKLDASPWYKVRCIKVTHEDAGMVIQEGELRSVLQQRLADYLGADCSDESDHDGCEEHHEQAALQEAAEAEGLAEGLGLAERQALGDGFDQQLEENAEHMQELFLLQNHVGKHVQ